MCELIGSCSLEIEINGRSTPKDEFCIGEYVTFICNLPGVQNFKWKLPGFIEGADGTVGGKVPTVTNTNYNLTATLGKSTLELLVFPGLHNVDILCAESAINTTNKLVQPLRILGKNHFIVIHVV